MTADQRVLRGATATLSVTLRNSDGTAAAASGAVTVGVARADGSTLLAAGTATANPSTGVYTIALTAAQTATLDLLTATWTDAGDSSTHTSTHEVVGGYAFSLADARAVPDCADTAKYPDATVLTARQEVEEEAEEIMDLAVVPRYARVTADGDGSAELLVPNTQLRTIRSVRIYATPSAYTALTASELTYLDTEDRLIRRADGNIWPDGRRNIVVEYEHGLDLPPAELRRAMLTRLRTRLAIPTRGAPDRAVEMVAEGVRYRLAQAGRYKTGLPDVDAVYGRYSRRDDGDGQPRPASRPLNLDPQRYSIFHGGIR